MGVLNSNQIPVGDYFNGANTTGDPTDRTRKDNLLKQVNEAKEETSKAIMTLGQAFFEATKDAPLPEYSEQIASIKACIDKEKLLTQYKLSFEGKMLCEACGQTIPADSVFCNKCGEKITPPDFSSLEPPKTQEPAPVAQNVCPNCGAALVGDAAFCEKCGTNLQQMGSSANVAPSVAPVSNVCPSCGAPLVEGAMFCEKCGHKM